MLKTSMSMVMVSVILGAAVLRDRRDLSGDGVVLAVATVDFNSKMILAGPDILSRGFIYMRESGDLIRDSQRILFNAIRIALKNKDASIQSVNELSSMHYDHSYTKKQNVSQLSFP